MNPVNTLTHSNFESNLTTHLDTLINNNLLKLKYFYIKDKIVGITNPGDEVILKNNL